MAKEAIQKTNALRILDAEGIDYQAYTLDIAEAKSGVEVARMLDTDPGHVFKTLVAQGKSGEHYVFLVPVAEELDLKKAAKAVDEKAIAMIKSKELLPLTGYVHGGCSPIGMKKQLRTTVDETVVLYDTMMFSGGRIGLQVELAPDDLHKAIDYEVADLVV